MDTSNLIKKKSVKYPIGYMAIYLAIQMFLLYNIVFYGHDVLGQSNQWGGYILGVIWGLGNIFPIILIKFSDKWGYRESLIVAGILQTVGFFLMSLGSITMFLVGASMFGASMCFAVSQNYVIMSNTMKKEYPGRFNVFLVSYATMNATSFLAGLISGFSGQIGYGNVFRISAIFSLVILIYTVTLYRKTETFKNSQAWVMDQRDNKAKILGFWKLLAFGICFTIIFYLFTLIAKTINIIIDISVVLTFVFLIYLALKNKGITRMKVIVFTILSAFSLVFWVGYNMYNGVVSQSILDSVTKLHGVAPQWAMDADPFIIVIFGVLLSIIFFKLEKKGYHLNALMRITAGLFILSLGMLMYIIGFHVAHFGMINVVWVMIAIGVCGFGEIFIGPVGTAVAGQCAVDGLEGVFIAVGFIVIGGTGAVAAAINVWMLSKGTHVAMTVRTQQISHVIGIFAIVALIAAILMAILYKPLTRLADFTPFNMNKAKK